MAQESRSSTQHDSSPMGQRKSGRIVKRPQFFSQGNLSVTEKPRAKRKRATEDGDGDNDDGEEDASEDDSDDVDSSDDTDLDELNAKKRAAWRAPKQKLTAAPNTKQPKLPAAKKPKFDIKKGAGRKLAIRPALPNGKSKARSSRLRNAPSRFSFAAGETGLYAEVFAKGKTVDAAAAEWLTQYQQDKVQGMCDMVNFILRCSGTDLQVDTQQIEDVDHVPGCIKDLQNDYQEEGITEYPLISKSKGLRAFPAVLGNFFTALIQTLHHSSLLYDDEDLFENLQIWVSSLSTAGCRPFRHTASFISLTTTSALCDLAREVTKIISTSRKQLEGEKKKKTLNKGRLGAIQSTVQEGEKKLEAIDALLKDSFDTVFVHRYRDVDARIRTECMAALGQWIRTYREYFFEGQYLRYFGWVLSDTSAHTRATVVAQLHFLYENKDNLAGLCSFTERFRPRLVEMAAQDAEVSVRAATVELLDIIRDAGLLEPTDVDTIGRLVFDLEPRVRKAAGRFFVANIADVYESTVDEVSEELNEVFGDEDDDEDDYRSPKRYWIKFKCLADIFQAYDEQGNGHANNVAVASRDFISGYSIDTRFVSAAEAIYPHMRELANWQSLAGYLLYDHSQIPDEPSEDDTASVVRSRYKMQEGRDVILLEVLFCAVKLRILEVAKSNINKKGRKLKALTEKIPELQEEMAHNLAQIIPQLMKKFGAIPEAASAVLRLEHLVDLDKIQDLQKGAAAYSTILNEINKQFLTHSDQDVLTEASVAFIHAQTSEEMKEALESKIQELWETMIDTLTTHSEQWITEADDAIPPDALTELSNTVMRISNLASVTDCTSMLEAVPSVRSKSNRPSEASFITLVRLARHGSQQRSTQATTRPASELVISCLRTLLFYFMWKVQGMMTALNSSNADFNTAYFETISQRREDFASTLVAIMKDRAGLDEVRFSAVSTLLDLQTLFATLRHAGQTASNNEDVLLQTQSLVQEIDLETQALIARIHSTAEHTYAKKVGRPLDPDDDDAPASDDEDEEDLSSDAEGDGTINNERLRSTIIAEQRLCELTGKIVLAIVGRVVDSSGPRSGNLRQRLLKNKSHLGHNYREVVAFLTESNPSNLSGASAAKGKKVNGSSSEKAKSAERVGSEDRFEIDHTVEDDEELNAEDEDDEENNEAEAPVDDDIEDQDMNRKEAPDPDEDDVIGD